MANYYTADLHLFHRNVIRYSNRPFVDETGQPDVDLMNETIITRINERVKHDDRLYILGDISFASLEKTLPLIDRINCRKVSLIPGNHDSKKIVEMEKWIEVSPLMDVSDKNRHVVLCHYSLKTWNRSHYGAYQLFGHSHGSMPGTSQSLDVGVDCWDYYPVTLDECIARMATFPSFRNTDHHQ